MHMAIGADNNYIPKLITDICSAIENNKDVEMIKFHIIDNRISKTNKSDIINVVKRWNGNLIL